MTIPMMELPKSFVTWLVKIDVCGLFMFRREAFLAAIRKLSAAGFKILIDLFASSPQGLRSRELPYTFSPRHAGESKMDSVVGLEYLMLLADKLVGHLVPIRFVIF